MGTWRHIRLAADDRFDPRLGRLLIKLDGPEKISVIGHSDRRHPEFRRPFHQLFRSHSAIEQRILGVEVEVNEGVAGHLESTISTKRKTSNLQRSNLNITFGKSQPSRAGATGMTAAEPRCV